MLHQTQQAYIEAKAKVDELKDFNSPGFSTAYQAQLDAQDAMMEWATEEFLPRVSDKAQFETVSNLLNNYKVLNLVRQEQLCDITAKWNSSK